jgi:hypothetical protein
MDQSMLRTLARIAKTLQAMSDELVTQFTGAGTADARARRAGHRLRRLVADLEAIVDEALAHTGGTLGNLP